MKYVTLIAVLVFSVSAGAVDAPVDSGFCWDVRNPCAIPR